MCIYICYTYYVYVYMCIYRYTYPYLSLSLYIYIYIYTKYIGQVRNVDGLCLDAPVVDKALIIYMRNFLGWLETRLAQNTLKLP